MILVYSRSEEGGKTAENGGAVEVPPRVQGGGTNTEERGTSA